MLHKMHLTLCLAHNRCSKMWVSLPFAFLSHSAAIGTIEGKEQEARDE